MYLVMVLVEKVLEGLSTRTCRQQETFIYITNIYPNFGTNII